MPPTLILIRHAEAYHNLTKNWELPDPALSPLGEKQCIDLREQLKREPLTKEIEVIVSSPFRRTLQTTVIGLSDVIGRGVGVEVDGSWQENAVKPCDTGSEPSVISKDFPSIDFSPLKPPYPQKKGPYAFTRAAVLARGQSALKSLYHRPEKVIAVVSHSAFLRTAVTHRRFANADYRIFEFEDVKEGGEFRLKEWKETDEKGGGMGWSEKGEAGIMEDDFEDDVSEESGKAEGPDGEADGQIPV
ncbi:PGAM-domain-containing protein [Tothia fuscella]|uniref:PGAM-domain-containing protein n=1 Tax=Tothia fuscella TaxID=1048955 RepID=A0A9P4P1A0_9PEZI|nr:PGAM-domain-containing protein [Tothia fuscella]